MTKSVCVYVLLMSVFCGSCDTRSKTKDVIAADSTEINIDEWNKLWKVKDYETTTKWYSETASDSVIIQSGFPRGGVYTDANGKNFDCRIFRHRVINESVTPVELTIDFSADSFPIPSSSGSYLKLFFPPDTLTVGKEGLGLSEFVATGFDSILGPGKPTILQRTVSPKEEFVFYTGAALYQVGGRVRAGLILRDKDLFYRIGIVRQFDAAIFPCGQIVLKK